MNLESKKRVRGSLGVLSSEQALLEQPFINKDLQAHPVLNGERGKEVDDLLGPSLLLSRQHELLL